MAEGNNSHAEVTAPPALARRNSTWPLAVVAAIFIIVPFLFWYGTWFGRELNNEEIERYLHEDDKPRHIQHALSQVAEKIGRGDESVRRWYPRIVALAGHQQTEVRMTAAWVMGHDNRAAEFHQALAQLVADTEPIVRRNAALALVRFGDARGRPELLAMLRPYGIAAPVAGTTQAALGEGLVVKRETPLARIRSADGQVLEVRSPLPGRIMRRAAPETHVSAGEEIITLAPDGDSVWEALRALYLVGERADLPEVERYAQGAAGMPERVREQAALTARAIQQRATQ